MRNGRPRGFACVLSVGEWIDPAEPDKDRDRGFPDTCGDLVTLREVEAAIASHDPVTVKRLRFVAPGRCGL